MTEERTVEDVQQVKQEAEKHWHLPEDEES